MGVLADKIFFLSPFPVANSSRGLDSLVKIIRITKKKNAHRVGSHFFQSVLVPSLIHSASSLSQLYSDSPSLSKIFGTIHSLVFRVCWPFLSNGDEQQPSPYSISLSIYNFISLSS